MIIRKNFLLFAICCIPSLTAAPLNNWKALDLENNKDTARFEAKTDSISLEGTIRADQFTIKDTNPETANFDYYTQIAVPQNPSAWASASLTLFGRNDNDRSYAMVMFKNGGGKAEAGFYPNNLVPVTIKPGSKLNLRLQVSEGEQRFKIWEANEKEPEQWLASTSIPFEKNISGVGLRTYALKGEFTAPEFKEGNVAKLPVIKIGNDHAGISVSPANGTIKSMTLGGKPVVMMKGGHAGPALIVAGQDNAGKLIQFSPLDVKGRATTPLTFRAKDGDLEYTLSYRTDKDAVIVQTSVKNTGTSAYAPGTLALQLGLDTCMASYPSWNDKHFPTFLRNEKTHFWGYGMSPGGSIVGIFSPDFIPSWNLKYNNGGHRINGIQLQLLTDGTIPDRLKQDGVNPGEIKPGDTKTWNIYLTKITDLKDVPQKAAELTQASFAVADRYTGEPGEKVTLSLHGKPDEVTVMAPDGSSKKLTMTNDKAEYILPSEPGYYSVLIRKKAQGGEKTTQAMLTVRKPWSWYMNKSREWAVKAKQKGGSHVESWYGFFPAFKLRHLIPNEQLDKQLDADFNEIFPTMYDMETMMPKSVAYPNRIQNHAGAAALYGERYLVTGDIKDLEKAATLCDYVIKTQKEDGAYRSHGTHYTSVIYVAKYIMEVMLIEKELGKTNPEWQERYDRHYASVEKAIDELARNLDNIETEGEMTFEDGMISCSYTQLAEWARRYAKPENRQKYIDAAEQLVVKHRCLSQLVQPDSRMHGASLRFWESQYDVLWCKNLMSSPHGWSAWRLYGLFDLYRLTGKIEYLRDAMNGMGTCASLINSDTGEVRWAFMVDPKITTDVLEPLEGNPKGHYVRKTVGEQYQPMVSQWLKAPYATPVFAYNRDQGGTCDNDVHEIFKCLAEHALTTTWLYIDKSGEPQVWNGKVERNGNTYVVTPSEDIVSEVHVNTLVDANIQVKQKGMEAERKLTAGLHEIKK